jgi:hypothetical protein
VSSAALTVLSAHLEAVNLAPLTVSYALTQILVHLAMEHTCYRMELAGLLACRVTIWTPSLADAFSVFFHVLTVHLVPDAKSVNLLLCSLAPPVLAIVQQVLTTTLPLQAALTAHFPTVAIAMLPAAALVCLTISQRILWEYWLDAMHIAFLVPTQIQFP